MGRPQIVVNVAAALQRRGATSDTGVAFMAYAGATGETTPVACETVTQIQSTNAPAPVQAYLAGALAQGAPKVWAVRAVAADSAAVTEAEWKAALGKFGDGLGPGQVLIPGVSTPAAHAALLDHAATKGRCALLDSAEGATAAQIKATATALTAAAGSVRSTLLAGWLVMPGAVAMPPSVIAAGLVGRNDAAVGHANNAPAGDQGRGAGYVHGGRLEAVAVTPQFTDTEHDLMHDAGVSVFRTRAGKAQLYGWVSLAVDDPAYRQLNHGRMAMQLTHGIAAGAEQFLFRPIDSQGKLYSELEGMLRGYLAPLYAVDALYGATADDAYDVDVRGVNDAASATAGELRAAIAVSLTAHTEKVTITVVTRAASQEA